MSKASAGCLDVCSVLDSSRVLGFPCEGLLGTHHSIPLVAGLVLQVEVRRCLCPQSDRNLHTFRVLLYHLDFGCLLPMRYTVSSGRLSSSPRLCLLDSRRESQGVRRVCTRVVGNGFSRGRSARRNCRLDRCGGRSRGLVGFVLVGITRPSQV